ncbi:tol-pal system-associated acyl-CoA thioesterase [Ottowia sp.]|uniref:tol-pal system-associated acyl-CoA thioesterase n=1 Tax=Ottowia sp. TaxID=1898956 RepID=UPI002627D4B3|nr:tol-pal system-associated acyl-CoA thioesterase [Ottowia sp.]
MTTFEFPVRIYWEDTDAGGIVFYANYLKFFERARTEWLRFLGVNQQALRERTGGLFVVSEASLKYHRPARLDDELVVTAQLQEAGRASLLLRQQAHLVGQTPGHALCCEGSIRIGWVDADRMRPARIPEDIVQRLSA